MAYLEEFSNSISARDYAKVMELWQEYCAGDDVDADEIEAILNLLKQPEVQPKFGMIVEAILPLIELIPDRQKKLASTALLFDIQTTQSDTLWTLAHDIIKSHFMNDPQIQDKLRLVGLRTKENFQGALSNLLLLNHIKNGQFVYHEAWGVGEIVDCSFIREQLTVEFENLGGSRRDLSFKNSYRSLQPLASNHVLALRYGHPEVLGKMAITEPADLIVKILTDLGPKTAQELKEFLSGSIIDDGSYAKWWQTARAKIKKDARLQTPDESPKAPYRINKGLITLDDRVKKALLNKTSFDEQLGAVYGVARDFPQVAKTDSTQRQLATKLEELLETPGLSPVQRISVLFVQEMVVPASTISGNKAKIAKEILKIENFAQALDAIDIIAIKKRFLSAIQENLPNWKNLFCDFFLFIEPMQLKEHIVKELSASDEGKKLLFKQVQNLLQNAKKHPETFLWYFQKITQAAEKGLYAQDQESLERFLETFLALYSAVEFRSESKELAKKMYMLITGDRFKIVRNILKNSSLSHAKEFLLLASKCQSFTDHDQKILASLVRVVHDSISDGHKERPAEDHTLWTSAESYEKVKEKLHQIGTVEMVENAREIEKARELGDLRENSEYKFAQERRARLQKDLKSLSDQFQRARIITPQDVFCDSVGIGCRVLLETEDGEQITYSILGPWDANAEKHVLSIESKIAQAMAGKKVNDRVEIKEQPSRILRITSIFE